MRLLVRPIVTFASTCLAQGLVAGLPACARACLITKTRGLTSNSAPVLAVPGGALDSRCHAELERVYPDGYAVIDSADIQPNDRCVPGEALVASDAATWPSRAVPEGDGSWIGSYYKINSEAKLRADLRRASWDLVKASGKPSDGIVSRHLNRPISMRLSFAFLHLPWIRPGHATTLTAICALAMFAALVSGTTEGLLAGAALFQLASIVDGVDGEIARVTQRGSRLGASLDTITDGFTNVGFIVGLAVNLALRGEPVALEIGLLGAASLALGCVTLAVKASRDGDAVTFDAVGLWLKRRSGSAQHILIAVTKRDFFALASMVMVWLSQSLGLLLILSVSCMTWFFVVQFVSLQPKGKDLSS
jgi:1L-myo-inositol 1-phosphate cytidylyltransferase / CDP-L-myo-inositol myo-inositolphosphotransferase